MTDRIRLTGIEVHARHGVLPVERDEAQLFLVDVVAHLDLSAPGHSDELADTLDYGALAQEVHYLVSTESHRLIETVAERVASAVLAHQGVDRVSVTVHKPDAPVGVPVADVSVTVERGR